MPVFICSKCGVMDNTAISGYWWQGFDEPGGRVKNPLCSECNPEIGKWHGQFTKDKLPPDSEVGPDGFVYHKDDEYLKKLKAE